MEGKLFQYPYVILKGEAVKIILVYAECFHIRGGLEFILYMLFTSNDKKIIVKSSRVVIKQSEKKKRFGQL